jgi:hypothetical protein
MMTKRPASNKLAHLPARFTQFVTTLVRAHDTLPDPRHGFKHHSG